MGRNFDTPTLVHRSAAHITDVDNAQGKHASANRKSVPTLCLITARNCLFHSFVLMVLFADFHYEYSFASLSTSSAQLLRDIARYCSRPSKYYVSVWQANQRLATIFRETNNLLFHHQSERNFFWKCDINYYHFQIILKPFLRVWGHVKQKIEQERT